jgi:hypothetical protein
VRVSHRFTAGSARFDEDNLVSHAGLVPLLGLAEQTGLPEIIAGKVSITTPRIKSGSANPTPKLLGVIAGMCAGADSIDDLDVLRAGGMPILFDGVYAPSTLGVLLREVSFGHARQLESVLREHLCALAERSEVLAGIEQQAFIDIDSLLRPVYGHAKQGASYGHTKIAGKQVLRKGLSPLATMISTEHSAPVIAGMRLRAGRAGSGKGAGRMVAQAIVTARAAGATGKILVRGDSAYGNRAVVRACVRGNAEFSLVMIKNRAIQRAIAAIPDTAWTPVRYPGAVHDCDTGQWISDAEVAEVPYTAFAATQDRITARLVVRRVCRRQGRPLPRRTVPGVALPPVLHQFDAADRTGRHRPPPSRDHRNRVRRPDRRALGAPAIRALRRQLRLGTVRRDRAQPAPCRRHPRWPRPRRRPGRDPAPTTDHRPRPTGPPRPHARPAPTQPLALGAHLAPAVGPDHRPQPTRRRLTPIPPATRPEHPISGKAGQTSDSGMPPHINRHDQLKPRSPT